MQQISFNTDKYLEKLEIIHGSTLFPIDWSLLKKSKCPLCFKDLKYPKHSPVAICSNPEVHKNFAIKMETLRKVVNKESFTSKT